MSFFNFKDILSTPERPPSAKSPPSIPFCTSPSQLEFTLDHDGTFSNTMGLRSPGGPMRGRSVKEFEEQLANLKKENFNLKLRIYFLEEKMGTHFTLDKDNVVKKYIELQVDYANLRKEMEEKQELLCQAVKAIELEEEEHKKYVSTKEDQLNICQQEIEDLRIQLQDIKLDSEGPSLKSETTGFFSRKRSGTLIPELQDKMKMLENELRLEKENNASFQLIIGQTETLKTRCDNMQREIQAKEEIIKNLHLENESVNARTQTYVDLVKELQEERDLTYKDNQGLNKKLMNETKKLDELSGQYQDLKKKYSNVKLECEMVHKKTERVKSLSECRVRELEEENEKVRVKLRDTQAKLEIALTEIKKNQNLAVSKSLPLKSNSSNTDVACISVQDPTTPTGTPQKDSLHVQVVSSSTGGAVKSTSSTSICSSPSSPDKFNIDFDNFISTASNDKIISIFNTLKNDYDTQRQKLFKLKTEQFKACEIIKNMIDSRNKANEEIQQYRLHIKNLEKELESVVTKPTSDGESVGSLKEEGARDNIEKPLQESKSEETGVAELYKALTVELETKIEILEATLKEKNCHMQKIRDQYDDLLNNLEEKEQRITHLEAELLSSNSGAVLEKSNFEKGDTVSEKRSSFYKNELVEKDKEIERLNVELKKCSCYLQEIVNKELWEKNKEIEKLHSRQVNSPEILKLRKDLTGKEQQLKVLKDKISELGLDLNISNDSELKELTSPTKIQHIKILQDELKASKEERDYFRNKIQELEGINQLELVDKLKAQVESLTVDLEKSEKLRRESNEVSTVLNLRLEELAVFLDSLLKQKSILGFLGIQKERKLREIINTSLDLSKSFNMSLVYNPDQSLTQLSNITSILNGSAFKDLSLCEQQDTDDGAETLTIVPGNITLTYQSHLYKQNKKSEPDSEEVITALREQIVNLKSELQLRDNELNRLNSNSKLSDTDEEQKCRNLSSYVRELSKVYITPQKSNTTSTTLKYQSDCASESEGWSEPDRAVSRARIGLSQSLPINPNGKTTRLSESTDEDNLSVSILYNKRQEIELQPDLYTLGEELQQKTEQLQAAEQKLLNVVAKELYDEVRHNLLNCEGKIINLERLKTEAENEVKSLQDELDNLNEAKSALNEAYLIKDEETKKLFSLLEEEKVASHLNEVKLKDLVHKYEKDQILFENKEQDFKELEKQFRKDLQELAVKLEEEQQKVKELEIETVQKVKAIVQEYSDNYIRKSEVENKLGTVNKLSKDLDDLKSMVESYEETIKSHKKRDQEFENKIEDYQKKLNEVRKELDMTTLEYSESVLEKTRLANDKNTLEQEVSRYIIKDRELRQQLHEIHLEIDAINQKHLQEMSILQKEKSDLQMKISVLESNNAELHNRFVKIQAPKQTLNVMPNVKMHPGISYSRQPSHPSFSSEEIEECSGYNVNASIVRNRQVVDNERQEANSSPDLGIESDQGRFSSLEIHTINRPLLQTIELTETMNNMLDDENNPSQNLNRSSQHCCKKSLEMMANENNELKRKLLRMRRAFEETANQLNLANQRKKEVEKTICKQIHKTSQVLRKAKANLDSGSENDMIRM